MKTSWWEERRDEAAISMENCLFLSFAHSLSLPSPTHAITTGGSCERKKINKKSLEFEYYRNRTETRRANMCVTFNGNNKKKRKKLKKIPSLRFSLSRTQYHHRYVVCLTWSNGKSQQANALEIKNIFQLIIHFSLFSYIFFSSVTLSTWRYYFLRIFCTYSGNRCCLSVWSFSCGNCETFSRSFNRTTTNNIYSQMNLCASFILQISR